MVFCNIRTASSTVYGRKEHQDSLIRRYVRKVYYVKSNEPFNFGGGKQFAQSTTSIIPVNIGHHRESNRTNRTDLDIPLHLSKTKIKISTMA